MLFNRNKDFTGDTVEVSMRSDGSSYVGTHGIDYDLWSHGYRPFIREVDVSHLSLYNSQPLHVSGLLQDAYNQK